MSIPPARLTWLVWTVIPAVLYLGLQAAKRFSSGQSWMAAGYLAMGVVIAAGALLSQGPIRPTWKEGVWFAAFVAASLAWLLATTPIVQVAGFVVAMAIQVGLIVRLRRLQPASQ